MTLIVLGCVIIYGLLKLPGATAPDLLIILEQLKNFAVLIGVVFTALFSLLNFQIARSNLRLAEEKLVTERLAKAFEQLGSENSTVKLGAIYTLERIATESVEEYRSIIEILASFIRTHSLHQTVVNPEVQAAFVAIAELITHQKLKRSPLIRDIDASQFYLAGAVLTNLDLQGVNLSQTDLSRTTLDGINLENSNLTEANLSHAYLGEANFYGANLFKAKLDKVNISEQQTKRSNFSQAILTEASLIQARLRKSAFYKANLRSAVLREANLREADFRHSTLSLADFTNADLSEADFTNADLINTKLDGADIYKAKFLDAKISSLELLKKAKNWETAYYDFSLRQKLGLP